MARVPRLHHQGGEYHHGSPPATASFGVISACYTNIAISVPLQRDTGILKRVNGTPLPSSVYLGA